MQHVIGSPWLSGVRISTPWIRASASVIPSPALSPLHFKASQWVQAQLPLRVWWGIRGTWFAVRPLSSGEHGANVGSSFGCWRTDDVPTEDGGGHGGPVPCLSQPTRSPWMISSSAWLQLLSICSELCLQPRLHAGVWLQAAHLTWRVHSDCLVLIPWSPPLQRPLSQDITPSLWCCPLSPV